VKTFGAAILAIFWASTAAAQMFKCVDARGVTHYADQPTAGCANAKVDIPPSPPLSGHLVAPATDPAQQEADFRRRQIQRTEAERVEHEQRTVAERRCAELQLERARLSSGRRIAEVNAQGERVFMDDDVRDRRLVELQAALAQCR
jgi:hypothetical protein